MMSFPEQSERACWALRTCLNHWPRAVQCHRGHRSSAFPANPTGWIPVSCNPPFAGAAVGGSPASVRRSFARQIRPRRAADSPADPGQAVGPRWTPAGAADRDRRARGLAGDLRHRHRGACAAIRPGGPGPVHRRGPGRDRRGHAGHGPGGAAGRGARAGPGGYLVALRGVLPRAGACPPCWPGSAWCTAAG